jgi:phosphoglycolate phosphatase-like HAD superfamily hydrolase
MRRLILFDIDGTMLSARGAPRKAFTEALLAVYGTTGPIDGHRFDGKTDPQIVRELMHLAGVPDATIDERLPRMWETYIAGLAREFGREGHETRVYPGVRETLAALSERRDEHVLGLLTGNIKPGADLKLASARIDADFRVGAFGSDRERRDALPAIAVDRARALTGIHFRARDIVIIGDTPADVSCGASLAVRTVAVATGSYDRETLRETGADYVFDDLSDTTAVLDALLGT